MTTGRLLRWWRADHRQDYRHAGRVALGLLVPGVALLAIGRPELMLYAVFGSFAGMYGRLASPGERLRHQLHGAGMLVTGVAIGALLSSAQASAGVLVACVTAFATIGSLVTDRLGLRPGGPFFGIFALGATATVDADLVAPWVAVAICAGTAVVSMVVGQAGARLDAAELPGPTSLEGTHAQAARYALATASAGAVGVALGVDHANWAMAAAAVPLAVVTTGEPLDIRGVVHRARHRLTGTFGGLVVTFLLLMPDPGPTFLAVAVIVLLFPTELFMSRHYGVALGFFTPLIMCMTELADPTEPLAMLAARGVDTVIGVVAGVAAARLVAGPRMSRTREAVQAWAG